MNPECRIRKNFTRKIGFKAWSCQGNLAKRPATWLLNVSHIFFWTPGRNEKTAFNPSSKGDDFAEGEVRGMLISVPSAGDDPFHISRTPISPSS